MSERQDIEVDGKAVSIIPYDAFEAANLFLATGRSEAEVLPRIGLNPEEWARLRAAYRAMPYGFGDTSRQIYFGRKDAEIVPLVFPPRWRVPEGAEIDLRSAWHIREAVRRNPFIGPFADCGWPYCFIAAHPEATMCCYTHDGETVFFDGKPLINRQGERLAVDAASFESTEGRWLRDRERVFGQGQFGSRPTFYWYPIDGVDRPSFQALNLRYARDANRAYYITNKTIRTKSPDAFEVLPKLRLNYRDCTCDVMHAESRFARDREAVYFYGARLRGAKPAAFRDLGHGYATDGEKVWFIDDAKKLIEGADAATFVVPGPGEPHVSGPVSGHAVSDRFRTYLYGDPVDPAASFEAWRPFFEARPDLRGWWWHEIAERERES